MLQVVSEPLYGCILNKPGKHTVDLGFQQPVGHLQASDLDSTPWGGAGPGRDIPHPR